MAQKISRKDKNIMREIQLQYGFMLERGYEIISVGDAFIGWQGTLQRADLFVKVEHTRGDDYVSFQTSAEPPDEFTEIESVVYAATGEKLPRTGNDVPVLRTYLDRIEAYFAGEYVKNPGRLREIREADRAASWAAYQETLSTVESISSEEPKKIPILHYPLMAVILLLLFGALTTLYMVLLNSLFSSFLLDPDASSLFAGVGAVLLAIGTMFFIRKWVKFMG